MKAALTGVLTWLVILEKRSSPNDVTMSDSSSRLVRID